jgi:hypothetical protein
MIVPVKSVVHVACEADVVTFGVALTPQDVDDPTPDTAHIPTRGIFRASEKSEEFLATCSSGACGTRFGPKRLQV